jgi:mersacidin/lichenicidin family type 2 lantibiotic
LSFLLSEPANSNNKTTKKGKAQMPTVEVIKAWKDEEYRDTLTMEERAQLPSHPSGVIDFAPPELDDETQFSPKASRCSKISCLYVTAFYTKEHGGC